MSALWILYERAESHDIRLNPGHCALLMRLSRQDKYIIDRRVVATQYLMRFSVIIEEA